MPFCTLWILSECLKDEFLFCVFDAAFQHQTIAGTQRIFATSSQRCPIGT